MKPHFADTWFYLALLDAGDHRHGAVKNWLMKFDGRIVTTRWVLAEVANAMSDARFRTRVSKLFVSLESNSKVNIVGHSDRVFDAGRVLFDARPDKEWSLTDCISFAVMEEMDLREALTGDRHFEQAGFVAIFAD